jgi:hypothetical protein
MITVPSTIQITLLFSLAPGFSRVLGSRWDRNRFNGFDCHPEEAAEAAGVARNLNTRLKPGANEMTMWIWRSLCATAHLSGTEQLFHE